eukprot:Hpha_TRINITY_DN17019_c4_g3::TRINITY_DN17019_c4_g3_i3::g.166737::m.166737
MVAAVDNASAAGADTACTEPLALESAAWRPAVYEILARCGCDLMNRPTQQQPWQFHPLHFPVGSSWMCFYTGTVCGGLATVAFLAIAPLMLPPAWGGQHPLVGLRYLAANAVIPGVSFASVRILWHADGLSSPMEVVFAVVGVCFCVAFPLALWVEVLRPVVFHARYARWETESWVVKWIIGEYRWEATDIGGSFSLRCGLAFLWYGSHARWFMICEMAFTSALGALIAPTLGSLSLCSRRNWVVVP